MREDAEVRVPVEALSVGDRLVSASGAICRVLSLSTDVSPPLAELDARARWPIRVARDAMGKNKPSVDLLLSPDQVVALRVVTDVLIPIAWLVNGSTVESVHRDDIVLWEVEIDGDDLVFVDGLPVAIAAPSELRDARPKPIGDDIRLLEEFDGVLLEAVKDLVATRAADIGWAATPGTAFFLLADGREVHHEIVGAEAFAAIPAGSRELRLCVTTFKPAWFNQYDPRQLGMEMHGLTLIGPDGRRHAIDLDGEGLRDCFHEGERLDKCRHRWTKAEVVVPLSELVGQDGALLLRLAYNDSSSRRWERQPATVEPVPG